MSRPEPSWPFGKLWISMRPELFSFTSLAMRSIICTCGCVVGSSSPQRITVCARAGRVMTAAAATAAVPAANLRRVMLMRSSPVFVAARRRDAHRAAAGIVDVACQRRDGAVRVAARDHLDHAEMLAHHRLDQLVVERGLVLPDQPDLDPVHPVGFRDDVVAEMVDQRLVEVAVDALRIIDQRLVDAGARPFDDRRDARRAAPRPLRRSPRG